MNEQARPIGGTPLRWGRGGYPSALVLSTVAVAATSVLIRKAYQEGSDPDTLLVARLLIPCLLCALWLGLVSARSRSAPRLSARDVGLAGAYGVGLLIGGELELHALDRLTSALVLLVVAAVPLWVALAERLVWGAGLGLRGRIAILAAIGGSAVIMGAPEARPDTVGLLLAAGASLVFAAAYLLLERGLGSTPVPATIAIGTAVAVGGGLALSPHALGDEFGSGGSRTELVLTIGGITALALVLALIAIRGMGAFGSAIAIPCTPAIAVVFSWLLLHESPQPLQLVGGAVVSAGLVLVCLSPRTESTTAQPQLERP